jgi:hypothetical protein
MAAAVLRHLDQTTPDGTVGHRKWALAVSPGTKLNDVAEA